MIFENIIHERIQYLYYFSFSPSNILSHYLKFKTSYLIILRKYIHDWLSLFSVFCISMYLGLTTWCWITCRGSSFLEKADFGLAWQPLVAFKALHLKVQPCDSSPSTVVYWLVLSLCTPYLGKNVTEISWVQRPYHDIF